MSTLSVEPLIHHCRRWKSKPSHGSRQIRVCSLHRRPRNRGFQCRSFFCEFKPPLRPLSIGITAFSSPAESPVAVEPSDVVFNKTFELIQTSMIEGKIFIKLDQRKDGQSWKFSVGCDLPGIWTLHWGVSYINDVGKEWDQPPKHMIPPKSIHIKDYAIETPLKKPSSSPKDSKFQVVEIDFDPKSQIAAINFVLKDESTGAWYQHKGRDFKVPLVNYLHGDGNGVVSKKGFTSWTGNLGSLSNMLFKSEASCSTDEDTGSIFGGNGQENAPLGFYEELAIAKGVDAINHTAVSIRKCSDTGQSHVSVETDMLGDVIIHWGVCRDEARKWEIPVSPLPPNTVPFRGKALRTHLKVKEDGSGSFGSFTLEDGYEGFLFVIKQNENPWLNCKGNDFYIPLTVSSVSRSLPKQDQPVAAETPDQSAGKESSTAPELGNIHGEMRHLMSGVSSEKIRTKKTKGAQASLLKEIEKLAAEAYSMFRSSISIFPKEKATKVEELKPPPVTSPGTGTGFEILCQGFNWESHKSGKWYMELKEKAEELSSFGFTVIWLPPPTESVSPEGYMPKDLYNLNSRYGSIKELKDVVKKFHAVGIKVLGDVVLNHRCAHYQNQNGVWNLFGGRLNWDDRAVVADDPHFQGRGNKSSGDSFHAAPNIDHSQDFVRKDIKEWLRYLRKEIGYDGWRLDFVRGFWGGYVKDYLEASEPYFAVGEYWDSLSYTYGNMDHNQDEHRQRIVDWINAADGTAGAFDVTTKGILHAALEKCEYWRLSDQTGKPPGVLGWWPSRAVTFIENHDTGSTQGHWRFPGGKEVQGYAYILTHPGTPSVFYDHIFSHCRTEIKALIALRNRNKLNCRSRVKITKAERDVYAAIVDGKVAVKIGPGHYEPSGPQKWTPALEGRDYKVWEASS